MQHRDLTTCTDPEGMAQPPLTPQLMNDGSGEVSKASKLLPIRIINSGADAALRHLASLGLDTPPWIYSFAYELESARSTTTSHVLAKIWPDLEASFRNQHFFAAETVESIVRQLFLLEVRKRCHTPSIIWLHDGFWIDKHTDEEIFLAAEKHVKTLLFPGSVADAPMFHITDLTEARDRVLLNCPPLAWTQLVSNPKEISITDLGRKSYSKDFPVAKFAHKQGYKRKIPVYLARVKKRVRHSWLR